MIKITVGDVFGRLIVVEGAGRSANNSFLFRCLCSCGKKKIVRASHLSRGEVQSCGCLQQESRLSRRGVSTSHGHCSDGRSATYRSWTAMCFRCSNPSHIAYAEYGGRGITVCERWLLFENFLADMGERPEGMTLDRIDVDKGYSPENCQWATSKTQARNRRNNHRLTLNGEDRTLSEWAEKTGIKKSTIRERLSRGWSPERVLAA